MDKLNWGGKGINMDGICLNRLAFADDVVLIGKSIQEIQEMAENCRKGVWTENEYSKVQIDVK